LTIKIVRLVILTNQYLLPLSSSFLLFNSPDAEKIVEDEIYIIKGQDV
jgi:hypothetical protein